MSKTTFGDIPRSDLTYSYAFLSLIKLMIKLSIIDDSPDLVSQTKFQEKSLSDCYECLRCLMFEKHCLNSHRILACQPIAIVFV